MNSFGRNHDSVKEDNSWEEIKGRDNDFEQNENDSDNFIDDVNPQEDFTNDLANQIPIIRYEEYREELHKKMKFEENMKDHKEDEKKWKEQKLESLQDGYLNYYDTVRVILTDYEDVRSN